MENYILHLRVYKFLIKKHETLDYITYISKKNSTTPISTYTIKWVPLESQCQNVPHLYIFSPETLCLIKCSSHIKAPVDMIQKCKLAKYLWLQLNYYDNHLLIYIHILSVLNIN